MAVELCKVALWIEALEPGKPLTFLDTHIRCGDSLIGVFDYEALRRGIPDDAYKPLTGDDKDTANSYAKRNKQQREGKGVTGFLADLKPPATLVDAARQLVDMPEDTLEEIAAKRAAFERLHIGASWLNLKTACDCYVAAFFIPKIGGIPGTADFAKPSMPMTDHVWSAARGETVYGPLVAISDKYANDVGAFHWPIEFPHIFARGGFDVAVGNPPWEVSQLGEQEYFAEKSPEIAAKKGDDRKKAIAGLQNDDPRLWSDFVRDKRAYDAANEFFRASGRFDLTAIGKINSYPLFAEHFARVVRAEGRSGVIVPTGIATDYSNRNFFSDVVVRKRLVQALMFDNAWKIFPAVHPDTPFGIFVFGYAPHDPIFCAYALSVDHALETERRFTLTADQITRINPNTRTAPVFRTRTDAELTAKIYGRAPVLVEERPIDQGGDVNPWGITFQQGLFNMTSASGLFRTEARLLEEGWQQNGADWIKETGSVVERRVPLYEAKMIHHFDHRWATYAGGSADDEEGARDTTIAEKKNPNFEPTPRYWVPESEVKLRAARVPASLKRAFREENENRCLKALAEWLTGYFARVEERAAREEDLLRVLGRNHAWRTICGGAPERFLRESKILASGAEMQRETPLTTDDVAFLTAGSDNSLALTACLIDRKQPRWLMGWRDITNATNERTVVGGMFPMTGVGNNLPIWSPASHFQASEVTALVGTLSSLVLDFVARHKVGGTHLNFFIAQQLPVFSPSAFGSEELAFIKVRVLELTYTSSSMRSWADDLGHYGNPFAWDEDRRAGLRAEIDACVARKYELSRDELKYILDPSDIKGSDYPSETFRVLKTREVVRFGEYRTGRLVLDSWDRLSFSNLGDKPAVIRQEAAAPPRVLRDGAWARPIPAGAGDAGAMLAAILKAMPGPLPARQVRLAATFGLEPRLLLPHLDPDQAAEWQRLIGAEAAPLTGNAASFAPRADRTWGSAVTAHRGNGRLVEDPTTGTWAPGPGLDAIDTAGWPDGRAGKLMRVLPHIATDAVISAMPTEIRGWIDAAAA